MWHKALGTKFYGLALVHTLAVLRIPFESEEVNAAARPYYLPSGLTETVFFNFSGNLLSIHLKMIPLL